LTERKRLRPMPSSESALPLPKSERLQLLPLSRSVLPPQPGLLKSWRLQLAIELTKAREDAAAALEHGRTITGACLEETGRAIELQDGIAGQETVIAAQEKNWRIATADRLAEEREPQLRPLQSALLWRQGSWMPLNRSALPPRPGSCMPSNGNLLANSESARVQFLLEFGPVQARFIEALLFLRCAYEPHRVHRKSKKRT